jgi:transmembrane sensor
MGFKADIVRKYLNGKFSLNDKRIVDEFFENDQYSANLNDVLNEYWERTNTHSTENGKNLDGILDRINHQILLRSTENSNKLKILWKFYSRVAAVLLLPIVIFSVYNSLNEDVKNNSTQWVEIHSPYGARTHFSLPDGSTGWLNSGSRIKYSVQFNSERKVTLNGEAYFDVVKNPGSPFIVDANQVKVKVLGTSFNVVSYDQDSISEVIVASGKVEVSSAGQLLASKLLPSERLVLNRSKNRFSTSTVDIQNYTSWKNGKLIFLNDNLDEVVRKVSRFYNVDFEVKENVNRSELFRAILEEESLEEVLRYMKLTMSIDYAILERKQDQDSRILKRKVIISNSIKK